MLRFGIFRCTKIILRDLHLSQHINYSFDIHFDRLRNNQIKWSQVIISDVHVQTFLILGFRI